MGEAGLRGTPQPRLSGVSQRGRKEYKLRKHQLKRLRERTRAIKELKNRYEELTVRCSELQDDTFSLALSEIRAEHERAVEQIQTLRSAAQYELEEIIGEKQRVIMVLVQVAKREAQVSKMCEMGTIDAWQARTELTRLACERSQYEKKLEALERQTAELDASLTGRTP